MWLRISSSGSFSSAERLISSIRRRCRRTLASRSFSVSSGLAVGCGAAGSGAGRGSDKPVTEAVSAGASSIAGTKAGAATRCVEKRPAISMSYGARGRGRALRPRQRQFEFLAGHRRLFRHSALTLRHDQLLELQRDLVALLDLFERYAAVDGFAHQRVVVRDAGQKRVADRLLDVGAAQARREHFLHEAVDDDLGMRAVAEPLTDGIDQLLGLAQARHRRLADDEKPI